MAFIRPEEKEVNFKIVCWGPPRSGKTTYFSAVKSKIAADKKTKFSPIPSPERTLFFDFLPLKLDKGKGLSTRFHIYTVPGQAPYKESRSFLLRGVDGLIVVLDSALDRARDNSESLEELKELLGEMGLKVPLTFVYNKQDIPGALSSLHMDKLYNSGGLKSFSATATTGTGVMESLENVIGEILLRTKQGSA